MDGLDVKLANLIDRTLEGETPDRALPESCETIDALFAVVSQYLELPLCIEVRSVAETVGDLLGAPEPDEALFRSALTALRQALDVQREQEQSANQFADDPELAQEFLVEAREHLAGVEAGMLTLELESENT